MYHDGVRLSRVLVMLSKNPASDVGRVANLRPIANRPEPRMLFKIFKASSAPSEGRLTIGRRLATRPTLRPYFHGISPAARS
jgi:hypothetical protein